MQGFYQIHFVAKIKHDVTNIENPEVNAIIVIN